jgi:hypothetical protein
MAKVVVHGAQGVEQRLRAISDTKGTMKVAATYVMGRMKANVPHRTSSTSRSFHITQLSENQALIEGNDVALFLETGTGLHGPLHQRITPKQAKVLRWYGGPAGSMRLSGRPRKGKAGAGAGAIFARSTAGMEARPYVQRSLDEASRQLGAPILGHIVEEWNGAA